MDRGSSCPFERVTTEPIHMQTVTSDDRARDAPSKEMPDDDNLP